MAVIKSLPSRYTLYKKSAPGAPPPPLPNSFYLKRLHQSFGSKEIVKNASNHHSVLWATILQSVPRHIGRICQAAKHISYMLKINHQFRKYFIRKKKKNWEPTLIIIQIKEEMTLKPPFRFFSRLAI